MQRIVQAWNEIERASPSERNFAMATVVTAEGSAYRRHGARMLVLQDGKKIGSISGGCLESDVVAHALNAIRTGEPEYVRYDSQISNGDLILELGCKGSVGILIEPGASPSVQSALHRFSSALLERRTSALATVFQSDDPSIGISSYLALNENGSFEGKLANSDLAGEVLTDLKHVFQTGRACSKSYFHSPGESDLCFNLLLEPIQPPIALALFGAGQDALPLVEMAQALGWQMTVADHRASLLSGERFPGARLIHCSNPESARDCDLDERTAIVIMTHNYEQDKKILASLLPSRVRYIGLVGPRERGERMLRELEIAGHAIEATSANRVFSPAGLDIGAEPSEGIALAVLSEIQAVFNERQGGFLRRRAGSIHLSAEPDCIPASLSSMQRDPE